MQSKRSVLYQDMGIGEIIDMPEVAGDEAIIFGNPFGTSNGKGAKRAGDAALDLRNRKSQSKKKAAVAREGRSRVRPDKPERAKGSKTSTPLRRGRIRWEDDTENQEWY